MADPVMHDPVDSIRSNFGDGVCPIAVVVAGGERGAEAPVGRVPKVGAKARYPPGRSPALVRVGGELLLKRLQVTDIARGNVIATGIG